MRCSYFKKQNKSNIETEEGNTNHRILQDLNNHNWLLRKLTWQINPSEENKKYEKQVVRNVSRKRKMSDVIEIDDSIFHTDDSHEAEIHNTSSSVPVSLPIQYYNKLSSVRIKDKHDNRATSGHNVLDNTTPDPKDVEVTYNIISKELNESIPTNVPSGLNVSKSELLTNVNYKQRKEQNMQYNFAFDKNINIHDKIVNHHSNKVPSMDSFVNEKPTFIKHKLPLSTPPERQKYKINENKILVINNGTNVNNGNYLFRKPNNCNIETQTDHVTIIKESEREIVDFIKTNGISVELMKKIRHIKRKDAQTSTDFTSKETNSVSKINEKMDDQVLVLVLEACSYYNKQIIALNSKLSNDRTLRSTIDVFIEKEKRAYLKDSFEAVFGSLFEEHVKGCLEEKKLDNLPDVIPKTIAIRKRRVSLPAVPHHNNISNEDRAKVEQHVPMAKKPQILAQHKPPMVTQLTYPTMPQLQQYLHMSQMVGAENNYVNRNVPEHRNYIMNKQYQCPRTQTSQTEIRVPENQLPFYNTGPRMMQPYPLQFTPDQYTECGHMWNNWNYPQQYPNITQNLRASHMYGNRMPACDMAMPEQRNPHHNQVQRNISNYTDINWNMNMRANDSK